VRFKKGEGQVEAICANSGGVGWGVDEAGQSTAALFFDVLLAGGSQRTEPICIGVTMADARHMHAGLDIVLNQFDGESNLSLLN
jgi:hypothetical protein